MEKYHIALSFAGEDRKYVESVANQLRASGVDVFYDFFEEEDLWGKDLYEHLTKIYRDQAIYTVMFVSEFYVKKLWGNLERKSAQARAFRESSEYILPATFDTNVEVPGMLDTTGYIDLNKKTPEQLADLIVRKLTKSGVLLEGRHTYSDNVKADVDYPIKSKGTIGKMVKDFKSYNWYTQGPAIDKAISLDWDKVSADDAFILGRNIYQCACGAENRAKKIIQNIRRELASIPDDRVIDILNGMFFEVYFDSEGEFRGGNLKSRKLQDLLKIQTVRRFSSSITFIRRALEPYKSELPFLPSVEPEIINLNIKVKKTDPPTIRELSVNETNILSMEDSPSGNLWRLSFKGFTPNILKKLLAEEWGIPEKQIKIEISKGFSMEDELRLPDETCVRWPTKK
ncbi:MULTISPECIES: toll/interleukin-1 receptor domain-containing protein [Pectobacterium]|uniref:toll/interleukin-1 receptor domain-containing protein n=1 Tax=Pectobacterium TaxID=122277 RepID=UPI000EAB50F4|nr:TIR domain-containing protein [Pectobacterium parmentieri]AYH36011.1 TIR domain-containing protein [Pectobacterium parmentieri]